jgi:hypoxanthine phosphoribosyltransferase
MFFPYIEGKKLSFDIEYEVPTWSQIFNLLFCQAQKIQNQSYRPDVVIAIAKGGLVSARILADLLETSQLEILQIEFYTGINQTQLKPTLKQPLTHNFLGKKILIVDDIADSGESLKLAQTHLQEQGTTEIKTATLYKKPFSTITPDFYEKQTSNWVVFPWETKETLRRIIQKCQGKRALNQEVAKLVKAGLPKQLAERNLKDMQ